jgi:hypothetical protein
MVWSVAMQLNESCAVVSLDVFVLVSQFIGSQRGKIIAAFFLNDFDFNLTLFFFIQTRFSL